MVSLTQGQRAHWAATRRAVAVVVTSVGLQAGCATAGRPAPAALAADQERSLLDLRAKNAGYVRQIEELENRIFILEDQLDSRKLAAEQRAPAVLPVGTLPVRALHPDGGPEASDPQTPGRLTPVRAAFDQASANTVTTIFAEHAVDYTGEANAGDASPGEATPGSVQRRPRQQLTAERAGGARSARPLLRLTASAAGDPQPQPLRLYREALEQLRGGHPEVALPEFRRFLDANPLHDYADNAQYCIGECHYNQREFRLAERAFREVVERYPRGNKVPDAMLKLGFTLQALGDTGGGRAVLESLARAFPKHEAARLASERLAHPGSDPPPAPESGTFGTILPRPAAPAGGNVGGGPR